MTTRAMIVGMLPVAFEIGAGSDFCPRCPWRDQWPDHRDLTTLIVVRRSPVSRRLLRGVTARKQMHRQGFAVYWRKLDAADDRFARRRTRKGRSTDSSRIPQAPEPVGLRLFGRLCRRIHIGKKEEILKRRRSGGWGRQTGTNGQLMRKTSRPKSSFAP